MEVIQLKSSVNWCKHTLYPLTPLNPNLHPTEVVYKFTSPYKYKVIQDETTKLPSGINFGYGPILCIGDINPQIGIPLKEICKAFDKKTGEEKYLTLIFDYDISGNKKTGIV